MRRQNEGGKSGGSPVPKRSQSGVGAFIAALAVATALGALGVAGWFIFGASDPMPWNKPASVDGAVVQLTYTGSECRDSVDAKVHEDSARVVITVHETVRALSCSAVGVLYDIEVRLDAPLADRELVDGACEMPEYASRSACASRKATVERGTT